MDAGRLHRGQSGESAAGQGPDVNLSDDVDRQSYAGWTSPSAHGLIYEWGMIDYGIRAEIAQLLEVPRRFSIASHGYPVGFSAWWREK